MDTRKGTKTPEPSTRGGWPTAVLAASVVALVLYGGAVRGDTRGGPPESGVTGGVRLEGTVRFEGEPPQGEALDMSADEYCSKAHDESVVDRPVRVGDAGALRDVIVFVEEGAPARDYPVPEEPVVLDQAGCQYRPEVLALRVGQTLVIRNSDETLHNVHVRAEENRGFNIGQPLAGIEARRTFEKAELPLQVRCDIHGWMKAHIGVFAHPFFAVTDADGRFELDGLAPGEYRLVAWHPALGSRTEDVRVTDGGAAPVEFAFSR